MINTQTRSDETGGESSPGDVTEYVNLWGPTQQDTLQKSLDTVKIKSFPLCASVRRNDLMTPVISWRWSNFSVIWCRQTIKKLITNIPNSGQTWLGAVSLAGRHSWDLKLHWQQINWHQSMILNKVPCCLGEWDSHAAFCLLTVFNRDNCPFLSREEAEALSRMPRTPSWRRLTTFFTSGESVQQKNGMYSCSTHCLETFTLRVPGWIFNQLVKDH